MTPYFVLVFNILIIMPQNIYILIKYLYFNKNYWIVVKMKRKIMCVGIISIFLMTSGASLSVFGKATSLSNEIVVPDDYPTIQEAIDNANMYDTIRVKTGTYPENIKVDVTALTIIGENPKETIIDGSGNGNVVNIVGDTHMVTISGFTIRNGDVGITFTTDVGVPTYNTITGNIISNNGIGIKITGATRSNTIYGNDFKDNSQNANDPADNTLWFDTETKKGNYWSDYTGTDSDGNGIGDTPYNIPGGNAQDIYPKVDPYFKTKSRPISLLFSRLLNIFPNALPILQRLLNLPTFQ